MCECRQRERERERKRKSRSLLSRPNASLSSSSSSSSLFLRLLLSSSSSFLRSLQWRCSIFGAAKRVEFPLRSMSLEISAERERVSPLFFFSSSSSSLLLLLFFFFFSLPQWRLFHLWCPLAKFLGSSVSRVTSPGEAKQRALSPRTMKITIGELAVRSRVEKQREKKKRGDRGYVLSIVHARREKHRGSPQRPPQALLFFQNFISRYESYVSRHSKQEQRPETQTSSSRSLGSETFEKAFVDASSTRSMSI